MSENDLSTAPVRSDVLPHQVKQALAYLRANFREKVTLADLAAACALSERTRLQQFRRFLGRSPMAHLLRMRLTAARADLLRSQGRASTSEIAFRCGLTHMGRFASEYRKAFGELPSATLQRAAGNIDHDRVGKSDSVPVPYVARQRPSLVILPLRTETHQERHVAQELMEQMAASMGRTSPKFPL